MAISFAADIRPLFTDTDIDHMAFSCDLSKYEDVKAMADDILKRLNGTGGPVMPPASAGGPWSVLISMEAMSERSSRLTAAASARLTRPDCRTADG